jgi:hypothetical protein
MEKMKNTGGGINELVNHTIARLMFKSSFCVEKLSTLVRLQILISGLEANFLYRASLFDVKSYGN